MKEGFSAKPPERPRRSGDSPLQTMRALLAASVVGFRTFFVPDTVQAQEPTSPPIASEQYQHAERQMLPNFKVVKEWSVFANVSASVDTAGYYFIGDTKMAPHLAHIFVGDDGKRKTTMSPIFDGIKIDPRPDGTVTIQVSPINQESPSSFDQKGSLTLQKAPSWDALMNPMIPSKDTIGYYFAGDGTRSPHMTVVLFAEDGRMQIAASAIPANLVNISNLDNGQVTLTLRTVQTLPELPPLASDKGWVKSPHPTLPPRRDAQGNPIEVPEKQIPSTDTPRPPRPDLPPTRDNSGGRWIVR